MAVFVFPIFHSIDTSYSALPSPRHLPYNVSIPASFSSISISFSFSAPSPSPPLLTPTFPFPHISYSTFYLFFSFFQRPPPPPPCFQIKLRSALNPPALSRSRSAFSISCFSTTFPFSHRLLPFYPPFPDKTVSRSYCSKKI